MAKSSKNSDRYVEKILATLESEYGMDHPKAKIKVYRYNSASIRIRIVDPEFAGKDLVERENIVGPIIESLPQDVIDEITVLLLIAPSERKRSFMSMEFEDPKPSLL